MATRREVLGAGLAVGATLVSSGAAWILDDPVTERGPIRRAAQALLVSESIALPPGLDSLAAPHSSLVPVIRVGLAQGAYRELKRVLDRHEVIAGLSTGASLFCIERIAWDHGLRLMRLQQLDGPACDWRSLARPAMALIHPAREDVALKPGVSAYCPSRSDGIVHGWILQKADPKPRHTPLPQEFA